MKLKDESSVTLFINGTKYSVEASDANVSPSSRLVDFIRDEAKLTGTKWTCREGGCGACVVSVRTKDPQTGKQLVRAVNSCLTPVYACDGWDISTIEDLGNRRDGYHPIQKRLSEFGGTQCGFCSPGMVMNMYSLSKGKKGLTSQDVEDNLDGSICRCTGYRPILDAFKTFTVDAAPELVERCEDIEELKPCHGKNGSSNGSSNGCSKSNGESKCQGTCKRPRIEQPSTNVELNLPSGAQWNKITDLTTAFQVLNAHANSTAKYRVVAGNTGTGVFKHEGPYDAFVEVNSIPELSTLSFNESEAKIGGGATLTKIIEFLEDVSKQPGFEYAAGIRKHLGRVANTPIRNFGTIAGNIMMKHGHRDFPSDVFLLLEAVGARVFVASSPTETDSYSLVDFLSVDMTAKLILYFTLPKREGGYIFRSFKITKRHQNAHAYVNAAFLLKIDPSQNFKVLEKPSILYGGINPDFIHASATEAVLTGAELGDPNTLKSALKVLESEVQPDHHLPDASPEYRRSLTQNLLYKVILGIVSPIVKELHKSGAEDLPRKLHSGKQTYEKDEEFENSPLYKPVHKREGLFQASGEAEYVDDIPHQSGELAGAFVLSTVANAALKNVDASEALKIPGVVTFLTARDIPGKNAFYEGASGHQEVFADAEVKSAGQAVGLIVAKSREIAVEAAKKVKIEYESKGKPVVSIVEAVQNAKRDGKFETEVLFPDAMAIKTADAPSETSKNKIKAVFKIGGQSHVHLENHVTLVIPKEDGYSVFSATQYMDHVQGMIAKVLDIPNSTIDVSVRRLGGAYGAKINRSTHVAVAAALASHVTRKPVRIVLEMEAGMEMMGTRLPYYADYEVGFDDTGKIDALKVDVICDPGSSDLDATSYFAAMFIQSCYKATGWNIQSGRVLTHTHANTWCRAPGTTQGIAIIENIMEHIADALHKDPLEVRAANFLNTGDPLLFAHGKQEAGEIFEGVNLVPTIIDEMKKVADYEKRKQFVEEFNRTHRWRKRGLSMVPMRYLQPYHGMKFTSYVAVHNQDGTVSVSHGGIECGQGINTKIAQVVAHELGIPLDKVTIKPSNNLVGANSDCTGGAITSELASYATIRACQQIKERMAKVKKGLDNPSWEELVSQCHKASIDMRGTYMYTVNDEDVKQYDTYGCNLTEVEVDILTGEFKIVRLDLIEDAGKSLSPEIDIGQIEGSLVMGLGLWTEEKVVFDPESGRLLTKNTWEYKVPFPKCIPEELNIMIMKNAPNPFGVLRSKATGEPPLCLSIAALFAIKNAIKAARKDAGNTDWFPLDGPVTPEVVVNLSLTNPQTHFLF